MKEEQERKQKMFEKMRLIEKMREEFEDEQARLRCENKLEHERREQKAKEVFYS